MSLPTQLPESLSTDQAALECENCAAPLNANVIFCGSCGTRRPERTEQNQTAKDVFAGGIDSIENPALDRAENRAPIVDDALVEVTQVVNLDDLPNFVALPKPDAQPKLDAQLNVQTSANSEADADGKTDAYAATFAEPVAAELEPQNELEENLEYTVFSRRTLSLGDFMIDGDTGIEDRTANAETAEETGSGFDHSVDLQGDASPQADPEAQVEALTKAESTDEKAETTTSADFTAAGESPADVLSGRDFTDLAVAVDAVFDQKTGEADLFEIARLQPSLLMGLALRPDASPELLEFVSQLGDSSVKDFAETRLAEVSGLKASFNRTENGASEGGVQGSTAADFGVAVSAVLPADLHCQNGHGMDAGEKFCRQCGSKLVDSAAPAALNTAASYGTDAQFGAAASYNRPTAVLPDSVGAFATAPPAPPAPPAPFAASTMPPPPPPAPFNPIAPAVSAMPPAPPQPQFGVGPAYGAPTINNTTVYSATTITPIAQPVGQLPTNRSYLKYWLLGIVTFGIYQIIQWFEMVSSLNTLAQRDGQRTTNPLVMLLLSFVTLGIYAIIWQYKLAVRIENESRRRGMRPLVTGSDFWIWDFLLGFTVVGMIIYLHKLFQAMNALSADYNARGLL